MGKPAKHKHDDPEQRQRELHQDLHGLMDELGAASHRELLNAITREELTFQQMRLLDELRDGKRPTVTQAGVILHTHRDYATRIVQSLARRGLVRREPDDDDYRAKRIVITDRGREAISRLHAVRLDALIAFCDRLEPAQRKQLHDAIRAIANDHQAAA